VYQLTEFPHETDKRIEQKRLTEGGKHRREKKNKREIWWNQKKVVSLQRITWGSMHLSKIPYKIKDQNREKELLSWIYNLSNSNLTS
jgi:hypothetical protein